MAFRHFPFLVFIRLAALFLCLVGLSWSVTATDYLVVTVLFAAAVVLLAMELCFFIGKTNRDLARFLDATWHGDFSQSPSVTYKGAGFPDLGQSLAALTDRFRSSRTRQEKKIRYLRAVVEHVPVPLMSLTSNGQIHLLNHSARRFFAPFAVTKLVDLENFGAELMPVITNLAPGSRRLVRVTGEDGVPQRAAISLTEFIVDGETQKLVVLQNISSELDATELDAWQQLVHVLTHEIMNSLTPVSSLAETAASLLEEDKGDKGTQEDVRNAVETVARRAKSLMSFVQGYRRFTHLPQPEMQTVSVADLFSRLERLISAQWASSGPKLAVDVSPANLELTMDPEQIEQVLINLLRNAAEALEGQIDGSVQLYGRLNGQGRVAITVADNGQGVPSDIADQIFIPFFTTKRGGSGIGLALTRQIMIAHKGSVAMGKSPAGGAAFTLTF